MRNVLCLTVVVSTYLAGCSSEDTWQPPSTPQSGTSGTGATSAGRGGAGSGGMAGSVNAGGAAGTVSTVAGTGGTAAGGAGAGNAGSGGATSNGGVAGGGAGGVTAGGAAGVGGTAGGGAAAGADTSGGTAGTDGAGTGGAGTGGVETGGAGTGGAGTGGAGTGGAAGTAGTGSVDPNDPFAILVKYRPSGSRGEDYDDWMNEEIGTPVVATTAVDDGSIEAPILVPEGVIYDGGGQTIRPSIPGCDGSQGESQPPVFILVPGAGVKNVTIEPPACDGIHMLGDNTLENIEWTDVGEDAASVRSYFPGGSIDITGGSARSADDKVFQFNAPVQVTITDFTATDISKLIRQNGGEDFEMSVHLVDVNVSDCGEAVVRAGPNCEFTHENVTADCDLWRDD
jgi:hypothetical protein